MVCGLCRGRGRGLRATLGLLLHLARARRKMECCHLEFFPVIALYIACFKRGFLFLLLIREELGPTVCPFLFGSVQG